MYLTIIMRGQQLLRLARSRCQREVKAAALEVSQQSVTTIITISFHTHLNTYDGSLLLVRRMELQRQQQPGTVVIDMSSIDQQGTVVIAMSSIVR